MGQKSSRTTEFQPGPNVFWPVNLSERFVCDSMVFVGVTNWFPGALITRTNDTYPLSLTGRDEGPFIQVAVETGNGDDTYNYDAAERKLSVRVDGSRPKPLLIDVEGHTVVVRKFPKDRRALKLLAPDMLRHTDAPECTPLTDDVMEKYKQTDEGVAVLAQIADATTSEEH